MSADAAADAGGLYFWSKISADTKGKILRKQEKGSKKKKREKQVPALHVLSTGLIVLIRFFKPELDKLFYPTQRRCQ